MSTQPLVLVADDEQRITKLVSMALTDEGLPSGDGCRR
jgi:CheY-like chemotaxis protein